MCSWVWVFSCWVTSSWTLMCGVSSLSRYVSVFEAETGRQVEKHSKESRVILFCPLCWNISVTVCINGWMIYFLVLCEMFECLQFCAETQALKHIISISPPLLGRLFTDCQKSWITWGLAWEANSLMLLFICFCAVCVCCDVNTHTQKHCRPLYPGFFPVSV